MTPEEREWFRESIATAWVAGFVAALRVVCVIVSVFVAGVCLIRWYW